jgi:hypothetical protein
MRGTTGWVTCSPRRASSIEERGIRLRLSPGVPDNEFRLSGRQNAGEWMTVVRITPNIAQNRLTRKRDPLVYLPYQQRATPAGVSN